MSDHLSKIISDCFDRMDEKDDEIERLKREITRQLDRTFAQCTRIETLEVALRKIAVTDLPTALKYRISGSPTPADIAKEALDEN